METGKIWQEIKDIRGWFCEEDIEQLATLKLPTKNPTILELGTHKGKSAVALRRLWPKADITTCDPLIVPEKKTIKKYKFKFYNKGGLGLNWHKKIDLLFVDDDHKYKTVKGHILKYQPLIKNYGYMVFHDYHGVEVYKAVNELLDNIKDYHTGDHSMAVWQKGVSVAEKAKMDKNPAGECVNCGYRGAATRVSDNTQWGCPKCMAANWWHNRK